MSLRTWTELTFSTNGHEFDSFASNKVQSLVDVGNLVKAHLATVRLGQGLARNYLQKEHELEAIPKVLLDVLDLSASFAQMGVDPSSESLQEEKNG